MAEHAPSGPVELGAPMDYSEHERTYAGFLALAKVLILATAITMFALVLFAFGSGGFWLGTLLVVMMLIATAISVVGGGNIKPLVGVAIIGIVFVIISVS